MSGPSVFLWAALLSLLSAAGNPPQKPAPLAAETKAGPAEFLNGAESLTYSINWPGGATLGEAHLQAGKTGDGWQFDFSLNASVPGFAVSDHYRSRTNANFCALELEKQAHTDIDISDCAHDGLDFIYYARREMALGHGVPKPQDVLFGAMYAVRMDYAGVEDVVVGGKHRQADHIMLNVRGPASDARAELFLARDAARTPLMVRVPFALGTFSMELVR